MADQTDNSVIFIIEDGTDVSASIGAMLEAANHQVECICDATCFSNQYLDKQTLRPSDIVMINLDGNRRDNFQLLNLLLEDEDGPAVIVMTGEDSTVRQTDQFSQSRFQVLSAQLKPDALLRTLETVL